MEYSNAISKRFPKDLTRDSVYKLGFLENAKSFTLVGFPVLVLLIISLLHIRTDYWEDEVFSITASRSLPGLFHMFHLYENNMSLYDIILHCWMSLFGESEVATHSLSLLFAVITIIVFFKLERNWLNKTSSFFGAMLLAVSPLFDYYSVETRSYALLILSVTVSTLIFVKLLNKPAYRRALFYGLSIGIGVYIHYFAILITAVHALMLTRKTLTRKYLSAYILAALAVLIVISPLILFPPQNKSQILWIVAPGLKKLWYVLSALFAGGYTVLLLAVCSFFIFWTGLWKKAARHNFFPEKLAIAWSFLPVLLIFVFSRMVKPVFEILYFSWLTPGVALFICLLVDYTSRINLVRSAIWILLLSVFTMKSVLLFQTKGSGFRESIEYVNQHVKDKETVLNYPYFWDLDINFYLNRFGSTQPAARPVPLTNQPYLRGGGGWEATPDFDIVKQAARKGGKVYLLCTGFTNPSKSDSNQNRIWLSSIKSILAKEHPVHQDIIFGEKTECPVLLQIYD